MEIEKQEQERETFHHSFDVPWSDWKEFNKKLIDWRGNYQMGYAIRLLIYGVNEGLIDMTDLENKLREIEEANNKQETQE